MSKETYIALLRGINVSGQKIIKMIALKKLFEDLGYESVSTYIQSGNVLFTTSATHSASLAIVIQEKIKAVFGFDVPVLIVQPKEIELILENSPFNNPDTFQVERVFYTLLANESESEKVNVLLNMDFGEDRIAVVKKTAYLYIPQSYGKTKLSNNFIEQKLKIAATTRNHKTMLKLLELSKKLH